tara:strand:- start:1976 stop:3160 length:1185 start_codon:yes stop_codon:yes gene_type:complete
MKTKILKLFLISFIGLSLSCKNENNNKNMIKKEKTNIEKKSSVEEFLKPTKFDTVINGKQVKLYWIKNKSIEVAITNYGGRIVGLWVPDKNNKMTDVVVGFGNIEDYVNSSERYFGATIGRVGNRIAKGKFTLEGKEYSIPINNGENTLHGGKKGFQDVVWDVVQPDENTIELSYTSPDLEEGFPGNLKVKVTYTATVDRSITMKYEATTDKPTVVNLTNHAFFNLNGEGSGTILNHMVKFYADKFTPVDKGLIPTGELKSVKGTPFDFTSSHTIGERIGLENEQLSNGNGYDHNFVLNGTKKEGMNYAATITGDISGITMDVFTAEPGLQFYSGNFMKGSNTFKSGAKDDYRTAFALETQHFPDAPNQPNFPSIVLKPGDTYSTMTVYVFKAK